VLNAASATVRLVTECRCCLQTLCEHSETVAIQHGRVAVRNVRRRPQWKRSASDRQQNARRSSRCHDAPRVALGIHEIRHAGHASVSSLPVRDVLN